MRFFLALFLLAAAACAEEAKGDKEGANALDLTEVSNKLVEQSKRRAEQGKKLEEQNKELDAVLLEADAKLREAHALQTNERQTAELRREAEKRQAAPKRQNQRPPSEQLAMISEARKIMEKILKFNAETDSEIKRMMYPSMYQSCYWRVTKGKDYNANAQWTESGHICQKWSAAKRYYKPSNPAHKKYNLTENYCRNPSWKNKKNPGLRPWCYTNRDNPYWEYCDVPACEGMITFLGKPENCKPLCSDDSAEIAFQNSMLFWSNLPGKFPAGVWMRYPKPRRLAKIGFTISEIKLYWPKTFEVVASDDCHLWYTLLRREDGGGFSRDNEFKTFDIPCEKEPALCFGLKWPSSTGATVATVDTVRVNNILMWEYGPNCEDVWIW